MAGMAHFGCCYGKRASVRRMPSTPSTACPNFRKARCAVDGRSLVEEAELKALEDLGGRLTCLVWLSTSMQAVEVWTRPHDVNTVRTMAPLSERDLFPD